MSAIYPTIFSKELDGYSVFFPDLEGCQTQGDTWEEAANMAQEALGLYLVSLEERKIDVPMPSNPETLTLTPDEFVVLITCEVEKYRRNKAIKKTLSIPQWLNDEAELRHINFSAVLQKALKEELQVME